MQEKEYIGLNRKEDKDREERLCEKESRRQ